MPPSDLPKHAPSGGEASSEKVDSGGDRQPPQENTVSSREEEPSTDLGTLVRHEKVGRYLIESKIGEGGMGVVYAALDPELNRRVALKILRPTENEDDMAAAQERTLREAQAMAMVSHPNLVSIFDVGTHLSSIFLAMEYIDGETLESWIATAQPIPELFELFEQAGRALQAIHDAGLVHRDFKPANVMVTADKVVKVLDLGIARRAMPEAIKRSLHASIADSSALGRTVTSAKDIPQTPNAFDNELTQAGSLVGTPAYMAPEAAIE